MGYYTRNPRELERIFGGGSVSPSIDPWTDLTPGGETRRYQNVPQAQSYQSSVTPDTAQDLGYGRKLMQMVQALDDRVQTVGRNAYGGMASLAEGTLGYGARDRINDIGQLVHGDRRSYGNNPVEQSELFATRALQAGGLTAAGAGLVNLTHAMQNQFGGPADQY